MHIQRYQMFNSMTILFWALVLLSATELQGQTFLEKLEAAVRERLNEPASTEPSQPASEEELPSPKVSGDADTQAARLPSILEKENFVVPAPLSQTPQSSVQPATEPGRIYLGLEAEELVGGGIGVRVTRVTEGSPAWKAGFATNDRISAINGFAIANLDGMVEQLSKTFPGQTARFLVSRAGRNIELLAVLMDAGLAGRIADGPASIGQSTGSPWLGVVVNDLTPSFRNQFGLTVFRGAAVTGVVSNSPAGRAGIKAGDAIIEISGQPVESADELMAWMQTARPGQAVEIRFYRGSLPRAASLVLEIDPNNRAPRSSSRATLPSASGQVALPPEALESTSSTAPAARGLSTTQTGSDLVQQITELRQELSRLKDELQRANQRLDATQSRLNQILDGLGGTE